jgi:hypothetical protein
VPHGVVSKTYSIQLESLVAVTHGLRLARA